MVNPAARAPRVERRAVPRLPNWAGLALAALAGAAQALSFAPGEGWWLQLISIGGLAALLVHQRPLVAAARAWVFGWVWLGLGLWWLFNSLHVYGGLPSGLAIAAVAMLAALLALYYALAAALCALTRRQTVQTDALLFAAWFLAAELGRATLFSGFPWIASGYAHTDGPLARWAPYIGVYGIGALAAWCAAVPALGLVGLRNGKWGAFRSLGPMLAPSAVIAAGLVLPQEFTSSTGSLAVSLFQTNVAQDLKFDREHIVAALDWHARQFASAHGDLIVTPESSLPVLAEQIATATWLDYESPFDRPGRGALVGIFTGDSERGYTNSVVGLSATQHVLQGTAYHYGKRHLLPFGEFVPSGFHWLTDMMRIPIGDQARGTETASFEVGGQRVRPLICYEDLFGEDFAASMVGPGAATMMANITNLAWFGPVMVQDQHLQFSRMRALEFQRGQVRATNTGATAVIDHRGVVTARLAPEVEGVLEARIEGRRGDTPYGLWLARWWLWPLWAVLAVVILVAQLVRRR